MNEIYILLFIMFTHFLVTRSEEVVGCGGFLKSHVPIDFSKVEVKLLTMNGIVKDRTSAAPNNGYYFVPLYDKGEMLLELSPPPGWSFEPKRVVLSVDGVNDLCSLGKDINFVFQGFGITGKVESLGADNGGPEGIIVQLQAGNEVRRTETDSDGNFFFTPVFPGNYTVSISHPKWKVFKNSIDVQVAESNTELPKHSLVIQGYEVIGTIKSVGEHLKEAKVLLCSNKQEKNIMISGCSKEPLMVNNFKNEILCHVALNDEGKFLFKTVPSGQYYIVAYYKGQNIYFHPERIDFTVRHKDVVFKETFEIVGFSIPGRVFRIRGEPIANAKIYLDGREVAKTDANGSYRLEKIKGGTHKLKAEAEDLIFEETVVRLSPSLQEFPDLLPSAFKVCGKVTSDTSQVVTFIKEGFTNIIQTETLPNNGVFCQYLTPGKYEVQVVVNEEDKQKGLQFYPLMQTIEVASQKIVNIIFSQLKTTIYGKVRCMQQYDCKGLQVIVTTNDGNEVALQVDNGSYLVKDMYPGTYGISISPNKFCWETQTQTVSVNSATAEVPTFIQTGYIVNFLSSHNTHIVYIVPGETKPSRFDIKKGRTSYCLSKPGEYAFTLESCHSYAPTTKMYKTNAEVNEVLLVAQKHTLKLNIKSESDYGKLEISVKIGTEKTNKTVKYNNGLYELAVLLEPGERAVIVPQSDVLFFTPPILSVEGEDDCSNLGVKFVVVEGKVFKGRVLPALAGVTVTVESLDLETLVVETDINGIFKFPPLDRTKQYNIYAKKESYILTGPDNNGNFLAHKLADVIVTVVDGFDNTPLLGVLLSISGGNSYHKNLQSNEDGKVLFHSLSPNEYFLRPMMKEYVFEPNSIIIPVNEGETLNVQLVGKRVAYSAFGQVVSLNGEPEENLIIVASGLRNCSDFSEETTCESSGQFRMRGLQPYCSYQIDVKGNSKQNNNFVQRSAPEFIQVDILQEDLNGLKLVVFHPVNLMDILVKVYSENIEHYKSLKLKLTREQGTSVVIHTTKIEALAVTFSKSVNPGIFVHLPSIPLDDRTYSLQLESSLSPNTKLSSQNFYANTSFKFLTLDFSAKSGITEQPIKQTSIWSLIFIFTVLFVVYNLELIANVLNEKLHLNINSLINAIPSPSMNQKNVTDFYNDAEIDQIVQSINNSKKKSKTKWLKVTKK